MLDLGRLVRNSPSGFRRCAPSLFAIEASCDDCDPELVVAKSLVDHRTDDDVGVLVRRFMDQRRGFVDLEERHFGATRDVDQHAARTFDRKILEQRTRDRGACRIDGPRLAKSDPRAHQRDTRLVHHRPNVGEVEIDEAVNGDQV